MHNMHIDIKLQESTEWTWEHPPLQANDASEVELRAGD